jgi:hypothetical protein
MLRKVNLPPVLGAAQFPDSLPQRHADIRCHPSIVGLAHALYLAHTLSGERKADRYAVSQKAARTIPAYALGLLVYVAGAGAQSPDAISTQSIATLKQQAANGDATAQVNLGAAYHSGLGVPKDEVEAVRWIRKAAEQGDARAQAIIGITYYMGQDVPQDYAEAYFWLDLAASGKIEGTKTTKEDLAKDRDDAASHLTPADLSRARERAQTWLEAHPRESEGSSKTETQAPIDPKTTAIPNTVYCDEAHGCTHRFTNGKKFKIISAGGMVLAVGLDEDFLPYMCATAIVYNNTAAPVDVIPKDFALGVIEPRQKALYYVVPEKVAKSLNRGNFYDSIMKMALKESTVDPGQSITGSVFFESETKARLFHLRITIAGTVYEFPFASDEAR